MKFSLTKCPFPIQNVIFFSNVLYCHPSVCENVRKTGIEYVLKLNSRDKHIYGVTPQERQK